MTTAMYLKYSWTPGKSVHVDFAPFAYNLNEPNTILGVSCNIKLIVSKFAILKFGPSRRNVKTKRWNWNTKLCVMGKSAMALHTETTRQH